MGPSQLYDHLVLQRDSDSGKLFHDTLGPSSIMKAVCEVLNLKQDDVSREVPLTSYGLDSLSAAALSFALRPTLSVSQIQLPSDMTIQHLEARLRTADASLSGSSPSEPERSVSDATERMTSLLSKLCAQLPIRPQSEVRRTGPGAVLVTGTTGSVGAHVLARILQNSDHIAVYALVQTHGESSSTTAHNRQLSVFRTHGLDLSLLDSSRLSIVACNYEAHHLGLNDETYAQVRGILRSPCGLC